MAPFLLLIIFCGGLNLLLLACGDSEATPATNPNQGFSSVATPAIVSVVPAATRTPLSPTPTSAPTSTSQPLMPTQPPATTITPRPPTPSATLGKEGFESFPTSLAMMTIKPELPAQECLVTPDNNLIQSGRDKFTTPTDFREVTLSPKLVEMFKVLALTSSMPELAVIPFTIYTTKNSVDSVLTHYEQQTSTLGYKRSEELIKIPDKLGFKIRIKAFAKDNSTGNEGLALILVSHPSFSAIPLNPRLEDTLVFYIHSVVSPKFPTRVVPSQVIDPLPYREARLLKGVPLIRDILGFRLPLGLKDLAPGSPPSFDTRSYGLPGDTAIQEIRQHYKNELHKKCFAIPGNVEFSEVGPDINNALADFYVSGNYGLVAIMVFGPLSPKSIKELNSTDLKPGEILVVKFQFTIKY